MAGHDQHEKLVIMNFVDHPPIPRAYAPGVAAGEFLRSRRSRFIGE